MSVTDSVTGVHYKEKELQNDQMSRHKELKTIEANLLDTDLVDHVKNDVQ